MTYEQAARTNTLTKLTKAGGIQKGTCRLDVENAVLGVAVGAVVGVILELPVLQTEFSFAHLRNVDEGKYRQ